MDVLETTQSGEASDSRIDELTKENQLLFEQLHVVQKELERYYHKLKEYEQDNNNTIRVAAQDSEILAENLKLRTLVEQQREALRIESTNSLAARLGQILIKGVDSVGSFIALPLRLSKMWKALNQTIPPNALGGKSFNQVLKAYTTGGIEAMEKLLGSVFLSPVMRANAYTAVARHVMSTDRKKAVELARLAWETDPRPYRLKWLAFRSYEADELINAEALLDMLPSGTHMSDWEERQAVRIRQEGKRRRIHQAQKAVNVSHR